MKGILVYTILALTLTLTGCDSQQQNIQTGKLDNEKPLQIVTSFYPLYEIAHQIGGNTITVKNMVPGGTEPHDYEPTPRDIIDMREASIVIYNGLGLEPWENKIIPDLEKNSVSTLKMSDFFKNDIIGNDPHFWLDPENYSREIEIIGAKIIELDPAHADLYEKNMETYKAELQILNTSYRDNLKTCKFDTFITNHGAFAYLAKRYHLNIIPIAGLSPDIEPSPKTMSDITKTIRQKGIRYILTETLVSQKIANTIAESSGAKTLILNPLEGLTNKEISEGKNYISTMKENLLSLQIALECR